MKDKNHLPMYGSGPFYVATTAIITVVGIILDLLGYLNSGKFEFLQIPFIVIGCILIIYGVILWILAVVVSKIDKAIYENKLVTDGIYSYVRNPIYSAFLILFTGICFIFNNLYLLILPLIFYIFLTILMIFTEEKWLKAKYGDEYLTYCKRTNRCIPFFPRKDK